MKLHTFGLCAILAIGAASLSGCSSGSSTSTPPQNPITVTRITVELPAGCKGGELYANSNSSWKSNFGFFVIAATGNVTEADYNNFTPDQLVKPVDITDAFNKSLNVKGAQIWYFLGGELPSGDGPPDGKTYMYCKDNNDQQRPVSFAIYEDENENDDKLLSSNLVLGTDIKYDGPIKLVGTMGQAASLMHGIYLYDSKHPHQHQQTDILNKTNKL